MAKKRVNELDMLYKKFSKMKDEDIVNYEGELNGNVNGYSTEIESKHRKIEDRQKEIEDIQREINEKQQVVNEINHKLGEDTSVKGKKLLEESLEKLANKKKDVEGQIQDIENEKQEIEAKKRKAEKELKFLKQYKQNKKTIDKIVGYKERLKQQLSKAKKDKATINKDLKALGKESKSIDIELKELDKKSNSQYTSEDATHYNELLERKEEIKKEKEKKKKEKEKLERDIERLPRSISKCDLAWKNLMLGRSWDEIHIKALKMDGKLKSVNKQQDIVQTVSDEEPTEAQYEPLEEPVEAHYEPIEEPAEAHYEIIEGQTGSSKAERAVGFNKIIETNRNRNKEMSLVDDFAQKHPKLAKLRDAFKRVVLSIKNRFSDKGEDEEDRSQTERVSQNVGEHRVEENMQQEEIEESELTRDAFIGRLQQMVDEDYKKQARSGLEEHYKKIHASKESYDAYREENQSKER